jgi:phosphatidylserine decarboxylase
MAERRLGDATGAPHEILDPRDLKFCSNQCTAHWLPEHDPFTWRDKLPFVRWGLAELQIIGWPLVAITFAMWQLPHWWRITALIPAVILVWWASFFRNPWRFIPTDADAFVAPADGTIADIIEIDDYEFFGGPAVRIGIFLSIFNVHINRAPRAARVLDMHYKPGEFLDARNPESAIRNEFLWIGLEDAEPVAAKDTTGLEPARAALPMPTDGARPPLKFAVRQISGLLARRIVCSLRPGQPVSRGANFGMIKLGSRTELILPRDSVRVEVAVGQTVQAGSTIMARIIA